MIAFFDLDRTLIAANSATDWIRRELRLGNIGRRQVVRAAGWIGLYQLGFARIESALHDAAAQLPRIAIQRPAHVIGHDTISAMQSGVFWGYIDLIDGLVNRIKKEYGKPMSVVATGGVAALFEGASETIDHYDQDLLIRGLLEIYRLNK